MTFEETPQNTTIFELFLDELNRHNPKFASLLIEENFNHEPFAQSLVYDNEPIIEFYSERTYRAKHKNIVIILKNDITYDKAIIDILARMINPALDDTWFDKMPKNTSIYDLPFHEMYHERCVRKLIGE